MKKVYIAKKGNGVVCHTSLEAMKAIDGIETPDMEITEAEFEAAGGLVRVIDGEIFLGKTQAELFDEAAEKRRGEINAELREIDAQSGRAARAVALAVANGETPADADVSRLEALETEAQNLRSELGGL